MLAGHSTDTPPFPGFPRGLETATVPFSPITQIVVYGVIFRGFWDQLPCAQLLDSPYFILHFGLPLRECLRICNITRFSDYLPSRAQEAQLESETPVQSSHQASRSNSRGNGTASGETCQEDRIAWPSTRGSFTNLEMPDVDEVGLRSWCGLPVSSDSGCGFGWLLEVSGFSSK